MDSHVPFIASSEHLTNNYLKANETIIIITNIIL